MTPTDRFFEAYDALKAEGRTSQRRICAELGIDRRNFAKQEADHSRRILQPSWLELLVVEYKVSAHWLLTGKGKMCKDYRVLTTYCQNMTNS